MTPVSDKLSYISLCVRRAILLFTYCGINTSRRFLNMLVPHNNIKANLIFKISHFHNDFFHLNANILYLVTDIEFQY